MAPNGKSFIVTSETSEKPQWLEDSFYWEKDLREKYWSIQQGDVVIDVGAAYGSYTLPALVAGATVVAMEPDKFVFYDLCTNVNLNRLFTQSILLNYGASDNPEVMPLTYFPGSNSTTDYNHTRQSSNILAVAIDTLVERFPLPKVDWLKIDVEGHELHVLNGAKKTLEKFHPRILIEYHNGIIPNIDARCREYLKARGYFSEEVVKDPDPKHVNNQWGYWS
jgi:FkbM family methyltransferase